MEAKHIGIAALVIVGLCATSYYYGTTNGPVKVETKTVVEYKDRVVYKKEARRAVDTKTISTKKPDGTVVTEIVRNERSDTTTNSDSTRSGSSSSQSALDYKRPDYVISAFATTPITNPTYGFGVSKRIVGPFTLGVVGTTKLDFGVSVGVMF